MPLSYPAAKNYQSPLNSVPVKYLNEAPEGPRLIACEIDWGVMGGPNNCVAINLQNNAAMNFSQITALSVDNSLCGADVQFVFSDTTETLTIPAYSPKVICPVFTNQTQFVVYCPAAQSEDISTFSIHNTVPPPIAVPTTQEQSIASNSSIPGDAVANTVLVPATVSGTLETAFIQWYGSGAANGSATWILKDGGGAIIASGIQQNVSAVKTTGIALQLSDVRCRFNSGLVFSVTVAGQAGSIFSANLYYRTP